MIMRSFTSKNIFTFMLLTFVLVAVKIDSVKGQKVYAAGTVTGGVIGSGILAGSPYGITRSGTSFSTAGNIVNILTIPNSSTDNFYYNGTIKLTNGSPVGVGTASILGETETIPAVVKANKGLSAVLIPVSGANTFIQFRYGAARAAGSSSYLKLKEKPIRNSTLDVAALGVLGLASTNIIAGEVYTGALEPQNYPGSILPLIPSSVNQHVGTALGTVANPTKTELVIDKNGEWYAIVTPTAAATYNSVRLTAQFPSDLNVLSLANSIEFNVYHAFTDPGSACSFRPAYTNEGKAAGINLNLGVAISALDLAQIVKDPTRAIDTDMDSYSSISSGIANVGVLNSVSQSFYFDHKAGASDDLRIQLGLQSSLIDLDLLSLNGITVKGYNGGVTTPVFTKGLGDLAQLLSLNLLNLVTINGSDHKKLDLTFKPGVTFDRVEVVFDQGLLGVGLLGDAMRIYDISMAPSLPAISVQPNTSASTNICEGSTASFSVTAAMTGGGSVSGYQWQYYNGSAWVNDPSGTNSTLNITSATTAMNNRLYRVIVTGGNTSCPQQVVSNEAKLTVTPKAQASDITAADKIICAGVSATLSASSSTVANPSFKWYNNAGLTGTALSTTADLTVSPAATTSYWVTVEGTGKCQNAPGSAKEVKVTVHPIPASPNIITQ